VINKHFEYVGDETRARVEKAIGALNYIPNATSRRLRSTHEFSVGMVIIDEAAAFLSDPFNTEIVAGLSNHLSVNNYSLSIQGIHPAHIKETRLFSGIEIDALCVNQCGSDSSRRKNVEGLLARSIPIILLEETLEFDNPNIAIINQDDFTGGHIIASHLLSRNVKKILFLSPLLDWPAIHARKKGVLAALEEHGGGAKLDTCYCSRENFSATQDAIRNYIRENGEPDAILGSNDRLGIAAMRYCQEHDLRVPEDILITGFNGFESSQYTNPTLTTVISSAYEMGQYAGGLIIQRLQTGSFSKQTTHYPVRFQQGRST